MKTLLHILFLIFISTHAIAQDNKDEAGSFFKTIVKTYFDNDCDKFYSFLNDTGAIISPNGVGFFTNRQMDKDNERRPCDKFEEFTRDLSSFQHYIDEYKIVVLDKKEFTSKNNDSVIKKISAEQTDNVFVYEILQEFNKGFTDCDFLVFGNIHKTNTGKNKGRGLFWMVVRKTKNGWKIFGTKA